MDYADVRWGCVMWLPKGCKQRDRLCSAAPSPPHHLQPTLETTLVTPAPPEKAPQHNGLDELAPRRAEKFMQPPANFGDFKKIFCTKQQAQYLGEG